MSDCDLCGEDRETERINVGDETGQVLRDICRQCLTEKLLPDNW